MDKQGLLHALNGSSDTEGRSLLSLRAYQGFRQNFSSRLTMASSHTIIIEITTFYIYNYLDKITLLKLDFRSNHRFNGQWQNYKLQFTVNKFKMRHEILLYLAKVVF